VGVRVKKNTKKKKNILLRNSRGREGRVFIWNHYGSGSVKGGGSRVSTNYWGKSTGGQGPRDKKKKDQKQAMMGKVSYNLQEGEDAKNHKITGGGGGGSVRPACKEVTGRCRRNFQ